MAPISVLSSSKGVQMQGMSKDLRKRSQLRGCAPKTVQAYVQGDSVGIRPPVVKVRPGILKNYSSLANFRDSNLSQWNL